MIIELIDEALIAHQFIKELETENTCFYRREVGSAIRFAVLHKLNALCTPKELHVIINQLAPKSFTSDSSFKKNSDLICVHHFQQLSEFKDYEEKIFALEEDPHYFKKYVLYYSDAEEHALKGQSYETLKDIIADKELFKAYKDKPVTATHYSVAAKIFIKLPFLELPFSKRELVPLRLQAEGAISEVGLVKTYENIQKLSDSNIDDLIKEMISDELANIKD
ncbi:ABC-three component system middle component 1 [Acinetobacter guillouiae]|uniref:ABC-three component system middle component 1 n=1 Tax=Acinetobacter guillouiae TaxID=106649 RepID=UPI003AF6D72E